MALKTHTYTHMFDNLLKTIYVSVISRVLYVFLYSVCVRPFSEELQNIRFHDAILFCP